MTLIIPQNSLQTSLLTTLPHCTIDVFPLHFHIQIPIYKKNVSLPSATAYDLFRNVLPKLLFPNLLYYIHSIYSMCLATNFIPLSPRFWSLCAPEFCEKLYRLSNISNTLKRYKLFYPRESDNCLLDFPSGCTY